MTTHSQYIDQIWNSDQDIHGKSISVAEYLDTHASMTAEEQDRVERIVADGPGDGDEAFLRGLQLVVDARALELRAAEDEDDA